MSQKIEQQKITNTAIVFAGVDRIGHHAQHSVILAVVQFFVTSLSWLINPLGGMKLKFNFDAAV